MKITNNLNLPSPFVDAVKREYEYKEKRYSVTSLLKGFREIILTRRHFDEMEQDVSESIWLILGNAVHKVLENSNEAKDELKEEKIAYTFENGYTLSGQQDLYSESLKRITDYKTGSVWKVIKDDFDDYRTQVLDYGLLFRKLGFECDNAEIVMILKDWSKSKAKFDFNYPQSPVYIKHFDFDDKDFELEEKRIIDKFNELDKLNVLPDDELPLCSKEERWASEDKWAVMKKGRKTAVKVCSSESEAQEMIDSGKGDSIEFRAGEDKKCMEYCQCCKFCSYYKEKYEEN